MEKRFTYYKPPPLLDKRRGTGIERKGKRERALYRLIDKTEEKFSLLLDQQLNLVADFKTPGVVLMCKDFLVVYIEWSAARTELRRQRGGPGKDFAHR